MKNILKIIRLYKLEPLVSIIVPCFNQGQYLSEALNSVLKQTYTNWECILVNDGSQDETDEISKIWIEKDNRFYYYHKENTGVSSTRNYGLDKARGQFIQFLDADDFLDEKKIELSIKEFENSNNIKLVISNFIMFKNSPDDLIKPYCNLKSELFNFQKILYYWNDTFSIPIHCGFFKSEVFDTIRFNENLTAQEDWAVWVKIFKMDYIASFIDKPLALYRLNPSSRTMTKSMYEDQIKVYKYYKTVLTEEEFNKLSLKLISRYYKLNENLNYKLKALKKSNSNQTGLLIKKILKKLGVLRPFRYLFIIILKFKPK